MNFRNNFIQASICIIVASLFVSFIIVTDPGIITVSSFGKQPTFALDGSNNIHVTFGLGNEIFYTTSINEGFSFSPPLKVGQQDKLALGATRGPQIVSTENFVVIAAADHTGKIMVYRLKHGDSKWSEPVNILKADSTAKEGFIALAAGKENQIYAAWLDLRIGQHNNIFGAYSHDGGKSWSESKLIYSSPDGRVCPCCRPSISADRKGNVYVMFRNDLNGARDLYLAHSKDGGKTFAPAQKLGIGTWTFDKCPMDGGAVSMDRKGNVGTTWRRENIVYYAEPGKSEVKIGEGRAPVMVKNSKGNFFAWQRENNILIKTPDRSNAVVMASGNYPRLATIGDEAVVCIWEWEGQIFAKKIFTQTLPESKSVKLLRAPEISAPDLVVGSQSPDITLSQPDGTPLSLFALRGKYVLIDFWASWCGPCRQENPRLVKLYNRFKAKGFEIFGVSLDESRSRWLEVIKNDGLPWYNVSDLKGGASPAAQRYNVEAIPMSALLDKEGRIIALNLRGEALEEKLEELMGGE